jgi:hypothetical protein
MWGREAVVDVAAALRDVLALYGNQVPRVQTGQPGHGHARQLARLGQAGDRRSTKASSSRCRRTSMRPPASRSI